MAERETQRLFFALWPGDFERDQLQGYFPLLRGCSGRRVPQQNLHLTLAFLGSVDVDTRDCLIAAAGRINQPSFTLQLDQLGFWRRPRVVWLGSDEPPSQLFELVGELKKAMLACGLEPENRRFQTHVTLLRKAHRAPRKQDIPVLEWQAKRFVLVASETRPEGVIYRVLKSWDLS